MNQTICLWLLEEVISQRLPSKFIGCQTVLFTNAISKSWGWNESHQGVTQSAQLLAGSQGCQRGAFFFFRSFSSYGSRLGIYFLCVPVAPCRQHNCNSSSLTRRSFYIFIKGGLFVGIGALGTRESGVKLIVCVCGRKPWAMKVIWCKSVIKKWLLHATPSPPSGPSVVIYPSQGRGHQPSCAYQSLTVNTLHARANHWLPLVDEAYSFFFVLSFVAKRKSIMFFNEINQLVQECVPLTASPYETKKNNETKVPLFIHWQKGLLVIRQSIPPFGCSFL